MSRITKLAGALALASSLTTPALAGEGSMGWVATLDLQPKGTYEIEQRVGLVRQQARGKYDMWTARSELSYGVTNDFQLSGYINYNGVQASRNDITGDTTGLLVPGSAATGGSYSHDYYGYSIEGIYRILNPVIYPVGVGIYLEYTNGQVKREGEARLILQSNFLDDKLVVAGNIIVGSKLMKFDPQDQASESEFDILLGTTYRLANRWTAGLEYRFHNDFAGYHFSEQTQRAHFIGPNVHYATKDWWVTAAWRYQIEGKCSGPGVAECSRGYAWDGHGRNEYMLKFGVPF